MDPAYVLALDPGREKVGIAVVTKNIETLHLDIVERSEITETLAELLNNYEPEILVIGDGTGSRRLAEEISSRLPEELELKFIAEADSSLQAAELYRRQQGNIFSRLTGKFISWRPSRPLDDYAALVLARKYLQDE